MQVRKYIAAALASAALLGGGLASAPLATADTAAGYIDGQGVVTNDWDDEGILSSSSYAHSNATALWQQVLWADGHPSASGVDCRFGPDTTAATKSWQTAHGLTADGKVGHDTFAKADKHLSVSDDGNVIYDGSQHDIKFLWDAGSGRYYVKVGSNTYKGAYYNSATACG
jgi:hypothetical protein